MEKEKEDLGPWDRPGREEIIEWYFKNPNRLEDSEKGYSANIEECRKGLSVPEECYTEEMRKVKSPVSWAFTNIYKAGPSEFSPETGINHVTATRVSEWFFDKKSELKKERRPYRFYLRNPEKFAVLAAKYKTRKKCKRCNNGKVTRFTYKCNDCVEELSTYKTSVKCSGCNEWCVGWECEGKGMCFWCRHYAYNK